MSDFPAIAALVGAAAFTLLTVLLLAHYRGSTPSRLLLLASIVTATWLFAQARYYSGGAIPFGIYGLHFLELCRNCAWLAVVGVLLDSRPDPEGRRRLRLFYGAYALAIAAAVAAPSVSIVAPAWGASHHQLTKLLLIAFLLQAILGLVLVEQLYRNTHPDARWSIKHLCLGIAAILVYDFVLYAEAALFNQVNPDTWAARGAVNALAVPLIAVTAARNREWQLNLFVSRKIVFHTTAVLAAGAYLVLMAGAGYYLKAVGGTWGGALRVVFFSFALVMLVSLIASTQLRSRLRVFLAKHFYRNKYDYGEVWLSFTSKLSQIGDEPSELRETMLKAIADIMDSTGGLMWQKNPSGSFQVVARWIMEMQHTIELNEEHPMVRRLAEEESSIDLRLEAARTTIDEKTVVPSWLLDMPRAWIVVPIVHREELLAFLVLAASRSNSVLTWEDRDLLRTLGRQAASYLALLRTTEALADARQFEAFNRLSAFLVHDLKNVVAQLSLVIRNAERHRHNPDFITDAFNTIGDAVAKTNRMLATLRQSHAEGVSTDEVELNEAAQTAITHLREGAPVPQLNATDTPLVVIGNRDRLIAVFEHLLQNAQDATAEFGAIVIRLSTHGDKAVIEVADSGCGMTQDFVQNRLFRPFDTTKGKGGMGVGVYESLHVVTSMGGRMSVDSVLGRGTTFRIVLPLCEPAGPDNATVAAAETLA